MGKCRGNEAAGILVSCHVGKDFNISMLTYSFNTEFISNRINKEEELSYLEFFKFVLSVTKHDWQDS